MKFPTGRVAAALVNYGTPDLTRRAIWSLRSLYPSLPIYVVESGSPDDSLTRLRALAPQVQPLEIIPCSRNVHHGPGLDVAIRKMEAEWALLFDSDCLAYRSEFLEAMLDRAQGAAVYMVGQRLMVDDMGYGLSEAGSQHRYPYVHPKCALLRRAAYLELPPFEKHGVPCLRNEQAAAAQGYALVDFPVDDYVFHLGRGTASRYGYRLGLKGWFWKVRHLLRPR